MSDYKFEMTDLQVEEWLDSLLPEITVAVPDHDPWL